MTRREGPIRVGVLGSDMIHALQYASVMTPRPGAEEAMIEAAPLRDHLEDRVAPLRCAASGDPERVTTRQEIRSDPDFRDVEVVCWWGENADAAARMAAQLGVERVVGSPEEMVGDVDAVMICTYSGDHHAELALPFLEAGVATFVDKPFATRMDDALRMVQAARQHGAVLFSSSPWKWSPAIQRLGESLSRLGAVRSGVLSGPGPGGPFFYVTHLVETFQYLFGPGVGRVFSLVSDGARTITAEFADGRVGFLNALPGAAWFRHAVVYGTNGYLEAEVTDAHRDEGQIRTVVEFVRAIRSGEPPLPLDYLLEATAVLVAAQLSAERDGDPVHLDEIGM